MRTLYAAITLLLIAVLAQAGIAAASEREFRARLTGDQEVPPVTTETSGKVSIKFNKTFTAASFTLTVDDGFRVTQSHIHCAGAGVNGPIVVFLAGLHAAGLNIDGKWISHATFTDTSIVNTACGATVSALAQQMRDGNTYVNVHTVAHPGGEIRGQLEQRGEDHD